MSSARASTASSASSPSARIVSWSPFLAPSVMILSELLALASRSPLTTTMSEEYCFAALTICSAGRKWISSSGPFVVSLSATNRSSPTAGHRSTGATSPRPKSVYQSVLAPFRHPEGVEKGATCLRRLRRRLDSLALREPVLDEERLGVDGETNSALGGGVVVARYLQRPLDALGLHHNPEPCGAAAHLNGDPYHLPTSLLRYRAARLRVPPPLLQVGTLDHLYYS